MKLDLNCEMNYYQDFLDINDVDKLIAELKEVIKEKVFEPNLITGQSLNVNYNKVMFLDQVLLESNKFPEEHWGPTKLWTKQLNKLKEKIENFTKQEFKVCVLIYYPDGNSGVDFHSDFTAFGDTTCIPSISLGEKREFLLKEKETQKVTSIHLENGSLIIMGKHCQDRYDHSLPINSSYKNSRINLTFRKYGYDD